MSDEAEEMESDETQVSLQDRQENRNSRMNKKKNCKRKSYVCGVCRKSYAFPGGLKHHQLKSHVPYTHQPVVKEVYACKEYEKTPKGERNPMTFKVCKRTFKFKYQLDNHIRKQHKEVRLDCGECGKVLTTKRSFNRHMKQFHTGDPKQYPCKECDKVFTTKSNLKQHTHQKHKGLNVERVCEECGKVVANEICLKQHIKLLHSQNREPHPCEECDRVFKHKFSLKIHAKRDHRGIRKKYPCSNCESVLSTEDSFKRHVQKIHTGIKWEKTRQACGKCDQEYKDKPIRRYVYGRLLICSMCYQQQRRKKESKQQKNKTKQQNKQAAEKSQRENDDKDDEEQIEGHKKVSPEKSHGEKEDDEKENDDDDKQTEDHNQSSIIENDQTKKKIFPGCMCSEVKDKVHKEMENHFCPVHNAFCVVLQ